MGDLIIRRHHHRGDLILCVVSRVERDGLQSGHAAEDIDAQGDIVFEGLGGIAGDAFADVAGEAHIGVVRERPPLVEPHPRALTRG